MAHDDREGEAFISARDLASAGPLTLASIQAGAQGRETRYAPLGGPSRMIMEPRMSVSVTATRPSHAADKLSLLADDVAYRMTMRNASAQARGTKAREGVRREGMVSGRDWADPEAEPIGRTMLRAVRLLDARRDFAHAVDYRAMRLILREACGEVKLPMVDSAGLRASYGWARSMVQSAQVGGAKLPGRLLWGDLAKLAS